MKANNIFTAFPKLAQKFSKMMSRTLKFFLAFNAFHTLQFFSTFDLNFELVFERWHSQLKLIYNRSLKNALIMLLHWIVKVKYTVARKSA